MFSKKSSNNTSSKDETLICNNCASDILQIHNSNERLYNVCYDFNEDTYTCLSCCKIITNPRIIEELDLALNPKSFFEQD